MYYKLLEMFLWHGIELQKVTREKDKLIDENEQLQQRADMITANYEKEKQVSILAHHNTTLSHVVGEPDNEGSQHTPYCVLKI